MTDILGHEAQDMLRYGLHSAVKVYGGDDCLEGVRKYGRALPSACVLLALAQQQEISQIYLLCKNVKGFLTYQRCSHLCQLALCYVQILVEKVRYHYGQHAVTKELQTLIAAVGVLFLVCV